MKHFIPVVVVLLLVRVVAAETVFVEAESFTSSTDAWSVANSQQTRSASRLRTIHGALGDPRGAASKRITLGQPVSFRVWVRYLHHQSYRGAFRIAVAHDGELVVAKDFDTQPVPDAESWEYVWDYVDVELFAATVDLELSKVEQKNCSSYTEIPTMIQTLVMRFVPVIVSRKV